MNIRLPILGYHHIGPPSRGPNQRHLTVSPEAFEQQLRWLHNHGYSTITPSQWLSYRKGQTHISTKPVMITIDDAYEDVALFALPILEKMGARASIFVVTSVSLGGGLWEERPVMTPAQIRNWSERGMDVGAHSRTHPDLTGLPAEALKDEINGSYEDLDELGIRPTSFAYPYGYVDDRVRAATACRFQIAFSCEEGLNDKYTDPLLMRRTMVLPYDGPMRFRRRVELGRSLWSHRVALDRFRSRLGRAARRLLPIPSQGRQRQGGAQ